MMVSSWRPWKAVGTRQSGTVSQAIAINLDLLQYFTRFKLHLRSKYPGDIHVDQNIPPLPPNKTIVEVLADYLRYLLDCAASYIKESHPNGHTLWISAKDDIYFVLSHPNGWEGKEQSRMRKAAVKAGLVPDDSSGHSRISFVTEGEASLHFAIENCVLSQIIEVWICCPEFLKC